MTRMVPYLPLILASLLFVPSGAVRGDSLPEGFRFIGNYRFDKRIKILDGKSLQIRSKEFYYRLYTDGITVRVYGGSPEESYTAFTIQRNDGIMAGAGTERMEVVPGLQAYSLVGNVLRQLALTEDRLVLTKFPSFSDVVEITYANRRITISRSK
jgi:hypothetical protein